jgi:hypothetical protein
VSAAGGKEAQKSQVKVHESKGAEVPYAKEQRTGNRPKPDTIKPTFGVREVLLVLLKLCLKIILLTNLTGNRN